MLGLSLAKQEGHQREAESTQAIAELSQLLPIGVDLDTDQLDRPIGSELDRGNKRFYDST